MVQVNTDTLKGRQYGHMLLMAIIRGGLRLVRVIYYPSKPNAASNDSHGICKKIALQVLKVNLASRWVWSASVE